ncbi:MAG: NAD-dependent epimerase/dehydratase family protein [Candidatus Micrarchaeota archaeon]|nr:NAD-dependent epimerase/dehydratase family protein [Candidatus Micrarchaeota archaeon]MDE1847558.1 NAD-dependent epimerase/dehydratase family protein [Candidatus Micrarchaeota archaeon]MDE1864275.1 NAD-dependent epimerase/dehydratase family protein [Candidatus Micrarchaeota archaeon]
MAGGAGFLGSHLAEALVANGDKVVIIDNLSSGLLSNLNAIEEKIEFMKGDITKELNVKGSIDLIVNMASRAARKEWETYPVEIALANSVGTDNLARLAISKKARLIYASTSELYANPEVVPTPETYIARLDHISSRAPYDESKKFGETLIKAYEAQYGLRNIIIRLFNAYGPRMRGGDMYGRVIDRFMKQALAEEPLTVYGTGKQTRSFTYVSDTIAGIMLLIKSGKNGEIYNLGSSVETSVIDLAKLVIEATGSKSKIEYGPLPPGDPQRRGADSSKISALGWTPKVPIKQGLRQMLKFYK